MSYSPQYGDASDPGRITGYTDETGKVLNGSVPPPSATGRYPSTTQVTPSPGTAPQSSLSKAETSYLSTTAPEDPSAITTRVNGEFSAEIAALETYYEGLKSAAMIQGEGDSGKARARVSSQGELGQDIGDATLQEQEDTNRANLEAVVDKEAVDVGAVREKAAATIEGDISSERGTAQTAAFNEVGFVNADTAAAQQKMQTIAGTYDLESLPQDIYDTLYQQSGFATPDEFNTFYKASRVAAQNGGKTFGDATTGVWQQQLDGTWKNIIVGTNKSMIGDPTTGVYERQTDGSYKQVIRPSFKAAAGIGIYDPATGQVTTPQPKIISSGGVIYSVDPGTNKATQLTANKTGWAATGSAPDNEKAAIMTYLTGLGLPQDQYNSLLSSIQSNPQAYFTALGNAAQKGIYTPTTVSPDTSAAATDLQDAAANAQQVDTSGSSGG